MSGDDLAVQRSIEQVTDRPSGERGNFIYLDGRAPGNISTWHANSGVSCGRQSTRSTSASDFDLLSSRLQLHEHRRTQNRERKCAENYNTWHSNFFLKLQSAFLVISNHNSFRVLFGKIASVYFIWKIYVGLYFSIGMAGPGNRNCANCIGTLSLPISQWSWLCNPTKHLQSDKQTLPDALTQCRCAVSLIFNWK